MEIYQRIDGDYANLLSAVDEKYGTSLLTINGKSWANPITSAGNANRSKEYNDYEYLGNGIFLYRWNRLEKGSSPFCYNGFEVSIDLEPIYRIRTTPYYNCSAGDFKYSISDYKYAYFPDWCVDQCVPKPGSTHPHNVLADYGFSKYDWLYNVKLGPTPTYRKIKQVELGIDTHWNQNYQHHYIGTSWVLNDNQTYGEYYARSVYWWEDSLADDINNLITLSTKYHGKLVGSVSTNVNENNTYNKLLLKLINHFSETNSKVNTKDWIIEKINGNTNIDYNLYGCKIICDSNTNGLVLDVPLTRTGPVGKLFLPFIKPDKDNRYTPTPYRCDFHNYLYYFIPWEKNNHIRYLMMTDTELCEANGYKAKAYIATRRGHTKDDMPYLSDEDVLKMDSFWGFGYHYRLDPNRLFESAPVIVVDSVIKFIKEEKNLFDLLNKETGVLFPIDNNEINWEYKTDRLEATVKFTGKRAEVFFMPTPITITIIEKPVNLLLMFSSSGESEYVTNGYGEFVDINDANLLDDKYYETLIDLYLISYPVNLNRVLLDTDLQVNFPMLKLFKTNDYIGDLPNVQVSYLTELLKRHISQNHIVYVKSGESIPKEAIINIGDCEILYNGLNTQQDAGIYYSPNRLENIIVIKPKHGYYNTPFIKWLTISYKDN